MSSQWYDNVINQKMAELRQAEAARQAELDKQNQVKAKQAASSQEVLRYLTERVSKSVDTGNLQPHIIQAYLQRCETPQTEYVRLAGQLLNSRFYGLNTETTRIDSATKLNWHGTEYKSIPDLANAIANVLGRSPLKGIGWLRELAQMSITDPDALDDTLSSPNSALRLYNTLKERYSDNTGKLEYDEAVLTSEDALFLAGLTGLF